ncbi:hypothetical protein ACHAP3_004262 [Botrytis cinerea]
MPPRENSSGKSDDEKLLIAILSLWDPLPPVDYHKLGALLGIKPGTARVRWHRFKAKLFKDSMNKTAEDDVKVEQTTAALDNPAREKEASEDAGIEQVAEEIDVKRRGRTGVRKRAATVGEPNVPPAQRRRINRSIGMSSNASTSKPRPGKERKTNKYNGQLEVPGGIKQEDGQFEDNIQWSESEGNENILDELLSGEDA